MAELALNLPIAGKPASSEEPKVTTALTEIQTQFNGKVATANLEAGAVTDAKVGANRALLTTNNNYAAVKTYTKVEAEAGVELSATRMVFANFSVVPTEIGGVVLEGASAGWLIPPGQKWKGTAATKVSVLAL